VTKKLKAYIKELEQYVANAETTNISISTGSVGWHVEHSFLVIIKIISAVINSDATQFNQRFNFVRSIIFFTKKMPRGKAKAPKGVQAQGATIIELQQMLIKTIEKIAALENATTKQYFQHPYFGNLNKKQTIRFLEIHTNHHLKIIKDILH
jgi:Protein of unknown function (DUF1569)